MTISIRTPDDFHLHLRQDEVLKTVAPYSAAVFARALVMPNILPPVRDAGSLGAYLKAISLAAPGLQVLPVFKILPGMSASDVLALQQAGAVAGKLYPAGSTTNAADGVSSIDQICGVLEAMQEYGLVLCIHGEDPQAPVLEREERFIPVIEKLVALYPRLRIVFEHLSCRAAITAVLDLPDTVAASITAHHLVLTLDDLAGGNLNAHAFCKPLVKSAADRQALIEAATGGSGRFFFGSDSAPHPLSSKSGADALPGIFSAPVALPVLAGVFEQAGRLDALEDFVSVFGARFYGLPLNAGSLGLVREAWQVPPDYKGFVPLMAGCTLNWQVSRRSG